MTTCYDSTTPSQIPTSAPIVAGYIDGLYKWSAADWARFPGQHVTISVFGAAGAQVADVERGDLTPQQGANWARAEIAAGRRPTIYSDKSTWPTVVQMLGADARLVDWWAADPTGTPHLVPGSVCTQYAWNSLGQTNGANVDVSVTNGTWPGIFVPVTPKTPARVGLALSPDAKGYWIAAADGGVFSYGSARFHGSMGGKVLSAPIVGITACGDGYYLMGADGAVYAFNCSYFGGANQ